MLSDRKIIFAYYDELHICISMNHIVKSLFDANSAEYIKLSNSYDDLSLMKFLTALDKINLHPYV